MKNIHILPTDKPSRLYTNMQGVLSKDELKMRLKNYNIYITSDEEIKVEDWFLNTLNGTIDKCEDIISQKNINLSSWLKKIILTTDQDLIGVQPIDDEFLEWFVKNSSCEEVEAVSISRCCGRCYVYDDLCVADKCCDYHNEYGCEICYGKRINYKIIIPKEESKQVGQVTEKGIIDTIGNCPNCGVEFHIHKDITEPKQETLEEAAYRLSSEKFEPKHIGFMLGVIEGSKWQAERMYSEEEVILLLQKAVTHQDNGETGSLVTAQGKIRTANFYSWFEKYKKK